MNLPNTNSLATQVSQLTHSQPWWVVLILLLIGLALAVGWSASKVTKALTAFKDAKAEARDMTAFTKSLLKARSRVIAFLLWVIAGLLIYFEWQSNEPVTRSVCLRMLIYGGLFFLFTAYLLVELWWFLSVRKFYRENPELTKSHD